MGCFVAGTTGASYLFDRWQARAPLDDRGHPMTGSSRFVSHARTRVLLLVQDLHVRDVNVATGELIRELHIDPRRDYQPQQQSRNDNS